MFKRSKVAVSSELVESVVSSRHFNKRWSEDLPACEESGIGYATNCIYREDGLSQQEHNYDNICFHSKWNENTSIYGIFEGYNGSQVAECAADTIAAEVLFNQLQDKAVDEEIKTVLRNAFDTAEKNYWASVDEKITERIRLQLQITENVTNNTKYQHNPLIDYRLRTLHTELSCGTSALVALIHLNRLYVANVGNSRTLLCSRDNHNVLNVIPLSQDHTLSNENEICRLRTLRISEEDITTRFQQRNFKYTRCLGNFIAKRGDNEFEELPKAPEAVTAEADIIGGITLNGCRGFLLLVSSGLYETLEQATGTKNVNKDIVEMVIKQFKIQSSLTKVVQAVVNEIARFHHDFILSFAGGVNKPTIDKREDITLLIRNFGFLSEFAASTVAINIQNIEQRKWETIGSAAESPENTFNSENFTISEKTKQIIPVAAYVNFSSYFELVEKARKNGTLPGDIKFF